MPNHTDNRVTITHEKPAMLYLLRDILKTDEPFNRIKPLPGLVLRQNWGKAETETYGDQNGWYYWCQRNWGTKWEAYRSEVDARNFLDSEIGGVITWSFNTAWCPPIPIFQELEARGFKVHARYLDEGWNFIGEYKDGVDSEYVDIMNNENVPSSLKDEFELDVLLAEMEMNDE